MPLIVLASCSTSAPKPPEIELYLHNGPRGVAICSNSNTGKCPAVSIDQTDRWFMLKPQDFKEIQDYIDLLVCKLNGACQDKDRFFLTQEQMISGIEHGQRKVKSMRADLLKRRNGN